MSYKANRYSFTPANCGEDYFGVSCTVQGQEQSIEQIFRDMVLGNYSGLTTPPGEYDSDYLPSVERETADPMNVVGMTLEEAFMLQQANGKIVDGMKKTPTPPAAAPAAGDPVGEPAKGTGAGEPHGEPAKVAAPAAYPKVD